MIGIMNVPCESATEYYATPELRQKAATSTTLQSQVSCNSDNNNQAFRQSSQKRLFSKRRSSQVDYLKDGRKMFDGKVVQNESAPQLWEKLLLRSLAHKIEDEIESPEPSKHNKNTLFPLIESAFECTASTLSLVSKDFLEKEVEKPKEEQEPIDSKKRSHSYDCPRQLKLDQATKENPL